MPRTRLFVDQPLDIGSEVEISGDQARYLGRVLRLRPDDVLTLFDGSGGEYRSRIQSISKTTVRIVLDTRQDCIAESSLAVHLMQGLSRGDRMDFVVQKATELGVAGITPVITDYSQVRLEKARAEKRMQHWRGVIASACEQCGRGKLPRIDEPITLRHWAGENTVATDTRLIMRPDAPLPLASATVADKAVTILIGPEGGFSDAEYELLATLDFTPVHMGPRILRTETAAVAAVAALQSRFGDMAKP